MISKYIKLITLLLILSTSLNCAFAKNKYKQKEIPTPVEECANEYRKIRANNWKHGSRLYYEMDWKNYKVYALLPIEFGVVFGLRPIYILYDGKNARKVLNKDELQQLDTKAMLNYRKNMIKNQKTVVRKLRFNHKKVLNIVDSTEPPNIPLAVTKYADMYMLKGDDRIIIYLMDWNGYHFYRVYWKRYGCFTHPYTLIMYDGKVVRRPSDKEFNDARSDIYEAIFNYALEQGRLHNKD